MRKFELNKTALSNILKKNISELFDSVQVMRCVFEHINDTNFKETVQDPNVSIKKEIKIALTNIEMLKKPEVIDDKLYLFELWIEYNFPKQNGVVIGTNVYYISFDGACILKDSFGTLFKYLDDL